MIALLLLIQCHVALPIKGENVERLCEMEKEHCRLWKAIGAELGVNVTTLQAIEKDCTNDADRLHAVIDSINPAPTLGTMTKILQSEHITNAMAGI